MGDVYKCCFFGLSVKNVATCRKGTTHCTHLRSVSAPVVPLVTYGGHCETFYLYLLVRETKTLGGKAVKMDKGLGKRD